jgi:hypothetical protein
MSTRGTKFFTSSFLVTQHDSVWIGSTMSFSNSPGLKENSQEDGRKDRAVGRQGECPWRRSMVATRRSGYPATVEFNWAGRWAMRHIRELKTLSSSTVVTSEGSGHDKMSRGVASDWFGGIQNPQATVAGLKWGVVHWARNKKVEHGGHSIYRGQLRLLQILDEGELTWWKGESTELVYHGAQWGKDSER